ncbi:MAG: HYR domain-containing protein, partial [Bacteroidetes bacterium]
MLSLHHSVYAEGTKQLSAIVLTETHVNLLCNGFAIGSIDLIVTGGIEPYSYVWTASGGGVVPVGQENNQDLTGLVAGTYDVEVTDKLSSTETLSVIITQPPLLTISASSNSPSCDGSTLNLSSTASGGIPNYTFSWTGPNGFSSNLQNPSIANATSVNSGLYMVVVTDENGCTATSSTTVVIRAAFLAPVASSNQTICYNTLPAALTATAATGGTGSYTYQWQSSPDGLTWNNITGATALTYSPLALTFTTRYRILVTDAGIPSCGTAVSSNIVVITVQAEVIPGVVAANQTICSGGDPAAFTITTPASGSGTLSYQWQSSTTACTGPWTDIPTATSAIYDPLPGLTQTTYYHRVVTSTLNGIPCTATSNCITITIQTQITPGTIAADQTLCNGGDPAILTGDAGSGGSGTITYRWESFTGGGPWTTIAGATSISYDPLTLIATTQYRRFRVSTLGGNVCESSASNIVTITIQPIVNPGTIGADQMICEGGDPSLLTSITDPSGGNPPLAIQWQTSTTSAFAGFTDIAGATSLTYDPGPFAVDTWFRRMVTSTQNSVLCQAFSNAIKVTVNNISSAGTIAEDQVLCIGQNPVPFTSVAPAAGDGTITYQWQSSTINATTGFSDIPGATGLTYAPLTPPVNTWYRRMAVSTLNGFVCSGSSNSVAILIGSFNPGTITPFDNDTIFCVGQDPGIISGTPFNLPSPPPNIQFQEYRWQRNTTGNPADFTDIIPLVNTQNYNPPVITISTWYRRVVYVKIQGKDCSAPSNIVAIRVYPVPTLTVSTPVVTCQGSNYTITATAGNTGGSTPIFTLEYVSGTYTTPPPVQTNTTGIFTITPPAPPELPPVGQQHFNVTITNGDPGACTTTNPVTVEIYDVPDITLTPSCAATSGNGFITMTGVVTYPAGSFIQYRIMLNPAGSWSPWQTNPIFSNLSIGSYTVEARNNPATSCTALLTGDVLALTVVTTDYSVCQNGTVPPGEGLVGVSYCITWGNVQSHVGNVCTDPSHTYVMSSQQYHYSPGPLVQYAIYATIWAPFGVMTIKDCPNVPGRTYSIYKYPFNPQNPSANFVEKILNSCPGGTGATVDSLDINSDYQIILNSPNSYTIVCTNIAFVTGQKIQTAVDIQPVKWYLTSTSTEAIYTGSPFNPLTTPGSGVSGTACPGTYIFYAGCGTGLCREPAYFIINPIPIVVAINDTICSGSTTNILLQSRESCNNTYIDPSKVTYQWYATPNSNVTGEESCTQANPCSGPVIALQLTSTTTTTCPVVTFNVRAKVGTCWGLWYTVNVLIINSNCITPPVAPANIVYTCLSQVPPPPILTTSHACLGTLTAQGVDSNNGGSGCPGNPLIITRTWVFHDKCITITVTQTIRVNDSIPPTFTRPNDITLYTDAYCSYSANPIYTGDVSDETDNCTISGLNAVYSDVIANGPCQGSKIITRTWSLTDGCNNTTIKVQTITVIDAIPPTFTRPPDIAINSNVNCAFNVSVNITGDVTNEHDNCSTGLQATYTDAVTNSNPCNIIITRTWHLVDNCGNAAADQVQTIIVHDILPPTFTRPPNITIYTDANCNYNASVSVTGDVTDEHDNCSTGLEATFTDVVSSGSCEGYRIITRTWHLADDCGNAAANQIQIITVNDNIPPTFTRPPDITIYADFNCNYNASLAVTGDVTNVHDNCSTGIQATYVDAVTNGSCQGKKIITRNWSLVDNCGNAASNQVQTITVNDITPPVITSCPSTINTLADPGIPYATISLPAPVYSDNCTAFANISVTWTMTAPTAGSGSGIIPVPFQFNIGTTTVTYTFTDACGNFSTCSFDVIVNPNYLPDITCPGNISQTADPGLCSAALNPDFPTLVSGTPPISYTWVMTGATTGLGSGAIIPNPYTFNVGVTTITWRATNIAGFDECTQTITVVDNQPPTFTAPSPLSFCVEELY